MGQKDIQAKQAEKTNVKGIATMAAISKRRQANSQDYDEVCEGRNLVDSENKNREYRATV